MKCRDLQLDLPLFAEDILSVEERSCIDEHLVRCPLCRQALADFQELRTGLRELSRPEMPTALLESIRASVREAIMPVHSMPGFVLLESRMSWSEVWLMPSAVAGVATLAIAFMLLTTMLSSTITPNVITDRTDTRSSDPIYLASTESDPLLTPSNYARSRMAVAGESPSVNPQGALIALTKSLVRGEMKDNEVVVVADVFGNGLAQIAEVVEPSGNSRAIAQLRKALESDPTYAPFVPANMDHRSDAVRVVLKIQSVNVSTRIYPPGR